MKKLILLFCLSLSTLNAQTYLDQSNVGTNTTFSIVDNMQSVIQTFKPGFYGTLDSIKVDIEVQNCPYPLVCKIYEGDVNGTLLFTKMINIPVNSVRKLQLIQMDNNIELKTGVQYALSLSSNCVSGPGYSMLWYKSVDNSYANGQAYVQWISTMTPENDLNDLYFQTFMKPTLGILDESNLLSFLHFNFENSELMIEKEIQSIRILNSNGQCVYKLNKMDNNKINLSFLKNGLYLIEVEINDQKSCLKIIL